MMTKLEKGCRFQHLLRSLRDNSIDFIACPSLDHNTALQEIHTGLNSLNHSQHKFKLQYKLRTTVQQLMNFKAFR
jgi:hypothetical protein